MSNVFVIIKLCYVHNQWHDISYATLYIRIMRTEHWLLINIQHIANKDYINKLLGSSQHSTRNVNLLITQTLGSVIYRKSSSKRKPSFHLSLTRVLLRIEMPP